MCGIAGLIHRGKSSNVGGEMTSMLQALKHRGPDSTGYAVYGDASSGDYIMRLKAAEADDMQKGRGVAQILENRIAEVDAILAENGAVIKAKENITPYALRYVLSHVGDTGTMAEHIEETEGVEILSMGSSLELIKDLGDANVVSDLYGLKSFTGTHGIGHTRMATESDVDIKSAHPYWAFPYQDVAVVHNGQLTNYWGNRRILERNGYRFNSNCDSEIIAVYIADKMSKGIELEQAMNDSLDELDGVFTYIVSTKNQLGMAKDHMAAKPMVIYEGKDIVACASEEVAIRNIFPHEIITYDPYEAEVKVWQV